MEVLTKIDQDNLTTTVTIVMVINLAIGILEIDLHLVQTIGLQPDIAVVDTVINTVGVIFCLTVHMTDYFILN